MALIPAGPRLDFRGKRFIQRKIADGSTSVPSCCIILAGSRTLMPYLQDQRWADIPACPGPVAPASTAD
ncbi:hypothetical protein MicloDRAFT_00005210 [Microvirga lotononidis]|uniref:Uncharacterized protein n=1 Tax=Microvirga lotononidis TaxID=864069 RepID=I4Z326_9HYPH|nr:hypothetical protein MicloDRAFT_00005210 [Microvirga lotononidis]